MKIIASAAVREGGAPGFIRPGQAGTRGSFRVRHLSPPTALISAAGGQFAFISRAQLSPPSARSRLPCLVRTTAPHPAGSSNNSPGEARASERAGGMAGGGGMVFGPHAGAVAGGDVVFCAAIVCLSLLSMVIFAAAGSSSSGAAGDEAGKPRRRGRRANGPVFVGGRGCGCGGCSAGAGVCGTYLS